MSQPNPANTTEVIVLGTIDAGNDGYQILLDLMRAQDAREYSLEDFTFSVPVALSGQNAVVDVLIDPDTQIKKAMIRNTRIFLTPVARTGLYGPKVIYYNRIHVSDIPLTTVIKGASVTVYDILEKFNIKTGLGIKEEDVFNGSLPLANPDGTVNVTLDIKPASIVFYGSTEINAVDYQFHKPLNVAPAGTVFGTYCQTGSLMKIVANGQGGVNIVLGEANSVACPIQAPYITAGTLFAEYCSEGNLMHAVANGLGGVTVEVYEANSASCPLLQETPAQDIVFAQQIAALVAEDVVINERVDALSVSDVVVLFQVGVAVLEHYHGAGITAVQAYGLISGSLSEVVVTSQEVSGHTHDLTVQFNPVSHRFYVTDITNNDLTNHVAWALPQGTDGEQGTDGLSAYDLAVLDGFTDTKEAWLLSLFGANGVDGTNGINGANGVNGTNGTNGAKGADGANGTDGVDGANGTNGADGSPLLRVKTLSANYDLHTNDSTTTLLRFDSAADVVLTIPFDSSAQGSVSNFPIGAAVLVGRNGVGEVTIVPEPGVTIDSPDGYGISKQFGKLTAIKTGPNHWEIEGNLTELV
jgi:hypothetical protein